VSRANREAPLARYTDLQGGEHRVVLRGRLLLDLADGQLPRLVARLGDEEGEREALALLEGSAIDGGYLERMRREPAPICRELRPDDLRPPGESADRERDREPGGEPERRAA
jgi:hypothetical protein